MMYRLITTIVLLTSLNCQSQTSQDKTKIYQTIIQKVNNKNLPVVNETFSKIYKYDIDGDFERWFYKKSNQTSSYISEVTVSAICATPIQYSQPVVHFLRTNNISTNPLNLLNQVDKVSADSLSNYLSARRLISWKKAPFSNSFVGNLLKKRKVIVLSNILFDQQNSIAIVKLQELSKNKSYYRNASSIIILKRTGMEWLIIGSLDDKQQPTGH